jgi:hypothetical protein
MARHLSADEWQAWITDHDFHLSYTTVLHLLFEQASITGEAVRMARHLSADE